MMGIQARMRLNYFWRTALPTAAYLLPILGVIVLGCVVWPVYQARDTQAAPHRRAEVSVLALIPAPGQKFGEPSSQVTLRLDGVEGIYTCYAPVRVGDKVRVDYRLGRSGRVYMTSIARVGP